MVKNLMKSIIAESQAESAEDTEIDGVRITAQATIDHYMNLPLSEYEEGTYKFWKKYSKSGDNAQQCLSNVARFYLTPPATSTDVGMLLH